MRITGFDHIVLCVVDVAKTREFYEDVLGLAAQEERPGKWSLHFGDAKISLQATNNVPSIAKRTIPGSGNFCLVTETPIAKVRARLEAHGVNIIDSGERKGAIGMIDSLYFNDPDGNLVEVSNRI